MAEPGDQRGLAATVDPAAERAFFAELLAAAEEAVHAAGEIAADLAVGGSVVRARFAGPAYAETVLSALGHLEVDASAPADATIVVWDSASTGVAPPRFPWTHQSHGQPVGFDHPDLRTVFAPEPGGLTMFDTITRTAVVWAPSAHELRWWEHAAPIRAALCWATVREGQHLVHAGAVGSPTGGVLLCGRGGSGKSTLALACVERGMDYVGDDYVLVSAEPAPPAAFCVYRSAKVAPASLDLVPSMRGAVRLAPAAGSDEKAVLDVARHRPSRMVPSVPLSAIVHPRITGAAEPVLRRVSPRDALMTVVPSTVFQMPGDSRSALATMSAVARAVPCYVLETGPDVEAAAAALESVAVEGEYA